MTEKGIDKYLSSIYFKPDHPASYAGPEKLYKTIKKEGKYSISRKKINEWISKQDGYSLQRHINRKFDRPRVVVSGIDNMWDVDTGYMNRYSKTNKDYKYIMLAIDVFSKHVWTRPLKFRLGKESTKQMTSILKEGRIPHVIRTDNGTEYKNSKFKSILKKNNIKFVYTENETKANYAERAIKTIKTKLIRYMTENNTKKWLEILPKITESYNNTVHRTIDMTPNEVNKKNEAELWMKQYPNITKKDKEMEKEGKYKTRDSYFKLKLNDQVRISQLKKVFQKEYDERWTREFFYVTDCFLKQNIPVYKLKDRNNEPINGIFYENELQKIIVDKDKVYKISKVLKKRQRNNRTEMFVNWLGWPDKFNSWIVKDQMEKYK